MSTFKKEQKKKWKRKNNSLDCLKRPCIFQCIQCFVKYSQAPGLHNFRNPQEHEILQKQRNIENNQKLSYEIFTQQWRYAKLNLLARCWRASCCASNKSSLPGDLLSVSTTPLLSSLSSISHRSVIKGQGGGGGEEKQTPQDSSESLCWEVQLSQIIQLWKLYLLSQSWNLDHSLPAWIRRQ